MYSHGPQQGLPEAGNVTADSTPPPMMCRSGMSAGMSLYAWLIRAVVSALCCNLDCCLRYLRQTLATIAKVTLATLPIAIANQQLHEPFSVGFQGNGIPWHTIPGTRCVTAAAAPNRFQVIRSKAQRNGGQQPACRQVEGWAIAEGCSPLPLAAQPAACTVPKHDWSTAVNSCSAWHETCVY
jgi:hypothetical protein